MAYKCSLVSLVMYGEKRDNDQSSGQTAATLFLDLTYTMEAEDLEAAGVLVGFSVKKGSK